MNRSESVSWESCMVTSGLGTFDCIQKVLSVMISPLCRPRYSAENISYILLICGSSDLSSGSIVGTVMLGEERKSFILFPYMVASEYR